MALHDLGAEPELGDETPGVGESLGKGVGLPAVEGASLSPDPFAGEIGASLSPVVSSSDARSPLSGSTP